ncbi:MAG: HlyD family efflux transporter periplasmic adaptor subunit [Acidobacteria bacterium]|nr:HlyD family efflux transporter periplasmic adaptor subunit [Acidobacteriota bacterium]MBV9478079.1 HlyD family efflux transporter periplasmic adaptor subunit [Acidobacteriota bacterium]
MDIVRPELAAARTRRRRLLFTAAILALALTAFGLTRLRPAAPTVDRSAVVIDTVRRGTLVREVRGSGTLVPENIRWIAAATEGRVDRVLVRPGTAVTANTIILELDNAEVAQGAKDAALQLQAAEADLARRNVELQSEFLNQRAEAARVKADFVEASLRADVDRDLAQNGLTSPLTVKLSSSRAEELRTRNEIEQQRLAMASRAGDAQLAALRARVEQLRALHALRESQAASLHVRAGIDGVLQVLAAESGQRVAAGANLARVAQPAPLKAQLRIAETQMRDVAVGQAVAIDTRNGIVRGNVSRIDPASQEGNVVVDVTIPGPLPRGARPDLTVDGTIELERLANVLQVGRPVQAADGATIGLFKLSPDGSEAAITPVTLGRTSVNEVEIRSGLAAGDRVILSDMSAWSDARRVRIQ